MSTLKTNNITKTDGSAFPLGKILQIQTFKRAEGSTLSSSSSTHFDFIAKAITTSSNDSKVLVITACYVRSRRYPGTESYGGAKLIRTPQGGSATTVVDDRGFGIESYPGIQIIALECSFSQCVLDTPGNAGTYTYTVQLKNHSGGNALVYGKDDSSITLLEIAA